MVPKMTHRGTPPLYEIPQKCKQHRGDNQQYFFGYVQIGRASYPKN